MGSQHAPLYIGAGSASPCQLQELPWGHLPAGDCWPTPLPSSPLVLRKGEAITRTPLGGRAPTHWACRDTADGTTAGFHSRNKIRAHTKMEILPLPMQKTRPQTHSEAKPWVCFPLLNEICPGSYDQIIRFCRSAES